MVAVTVIEDKVAADGLALDLGTVLGKRCVCKNLKSCDVCDWSTTKKVVVCNLYTSQKV